MEEPFGNFVVEFLRCEPPETVDFLVRERLTPVQGAAEARR